METSDSPQYETRCCGQSQSKGAPPTWLVVCGAITVQVGFGIYPVVVRKFGTEEKANPYIFTFYRDACAFPVLLTYSLMVERTLVIPSLRMVPLFMLLGLFGMFGSQWLYITGVYKVGADVASVFQPLVPVWTTVFSIAFCIERVGSPARVHTWAKFLGILLAAGGAIEIILTGTLGGSADDNAVKFSNNSFNYSLTSNFTANRSAISVSSLKSNQAILGYMALAIEMPTAAIYALLQKKFIFNNPKSKWKEYPIAITSTSYFFGAIYMGLSSMYFLFSGQEEDFRIPRSSYIALVYAVFITSALCYGLFTWTNKYLPSSIVTAFWPVQALVTVLVSFVVTGEQLSQWQYVGGIVLICGLMSVIYSNYMDKKSASGAETTRLDCFCQSMSTSNITDLTETKGKAKAEQSIPLLSSSQEQCTTAEAHLTEETTLD